MSAMTDEYLIPDNMLLGSLKKSRVNIREQKRQRREAEEILKRFAKQPGVILADEVGMGKTFVALAVAYAIALQNTRGPVVVMVPKNLVDKWCRDLDAFCDLYLPGRKAVQCGGNATHAELSQSNVVRFGAAYNSVEYLKLLDDPKRTRCHIIFLAHGAMSSGLSDSWVRLALIRETLKRHGRRKKLSKIRKQIHRFLAELLWIKFRQNASSKKEEIWQLLLTYDPSMWKSLFNTNLKSPKDKLNDDPVPKAVLKAISKADLNAFAEALEAMPIRTSNDHNRLSERIGKARKALRTEEEKLWKVIVSEARWRSPLLIMDEAHHLKNPGTLLARQLQSLDSENDLKVGDGALSKSFDRMLFLTATPFQLGHHELVRVLRRFGDVRWDNSIFGTIDEFHQHLDTIKELLSAAQLSSIRLFNAWSKIEVKDKSESEMSLDSQQAICSKEKTQQSLQEKIFHNALAECHKKREHAEARLRKWIIRYNKGDVWPGTFIGRRKRLEGAKILAQPGSGGINIPPDQIMPFFLAARSAADAGKDTLGEALSSSYEAFRFTRMENRDDKDDRTENQLSQQAQKSWYLNEFDQVLDRISDRLHPKMSATVQRVVDLWEQGEKVLVFAFYRKTCRALRIHISDEMERRIITHAKRRLAGAGAASDDQTIEDLIKRIQERYFNKQTKAGQTLDRALNNIIQPYIEPLEKFNVEVESIKDILQRFLRVRTTLVRAFPIHKYKELKPHLAVRSMLDCQDKSGVSWRDKFNAFLRFIIDECAPKERIDFLNAVKQTQTGRIRLQRGEVAPDGDEENEQDAAMTLANIQMATGTTKQEARSRLMMAFNTPFFPDVLVCSKVMGEGVDLHRYCSHVIHHDLDWNPSDIEQRTGRIDRLGCKAEGKHSIELFLPYLAGTADERQYHVMTEREKWFRIVMGQEEINQLIHDSDDASRPLLPEAIQKMLVFKLEI